MVIMKFMFQSCCDGNEDGERSDEVKWMGGDETVGWIHTRSLW